MKVKRKEAALLAEFFGTFVLVTAVLATANIGHAFFPAITAGIVLMVMVLVIGGLSGSHINPAVTIGFWSQKKIDTLQAMSYIVAQIVGGLVAWGTVQWLLDTKINSAISKSVDWRVLVAELVGTFVFTAGVATAVGKQLEGASLALAVGFSLTVGIIVASVGSSGLLNPAVAVGLHSYSLAYIVGPLVGGVLGMAFYKHVLDADSPKSKKRR